MKNKNTLVSEIVTNSVYTPDSKMRQDLERALLKLSMSHLSALSTILSIKVLDGISKASR